MYTMTIRFQRKVPKDVYCNAFLFSRLTDFGLIRSESF